MVCKFVRAKLLKRLEIIYHFSRLILEMMTLDDYRANSRNFHEFANFTFLWNQLLWTFSLCFLG